MPNEYDDLVAPVVAQGDQTPKKDDNPYADIAAQYTHANDQALRVSMHTAVETDADRHARVLALSDKTNLPPSVVDRNLDLVSKNAKLQDVDYNRLEASHPELSQWLSDHNNAAVAQDDLPVLQTLDHAVHALTNPKDDQTGTLPPGFIYNRDGDIIEPDGNGQSTFIGDLSNLSAVLNQRGEHDFAEQADRESRIAILKQNYKDDGFVTQVGAGALGSATGSLLLNGLRLGDAITGHGISDEDTAAIGAMDEAASENAPGISGKIGRGAIGMATDLPLMFTGAPFAKAAGSLAKVAGITGKLAKGIETAGAFLPINAANAIESTRLHGAGYGAADLLINSAIPGAFGAFGHAGAVRNLLPATEEAAAAGAGSWGAAAKRLVADVGIQSSQNIVTDVASALHEYASGVDPHALDADKFGARLLVSSIMGAGQALAFSAPGHIGDKFVRDHIAADEAVSYADRLTMAVDTLKASKTNERAPEVMATLLNQMGGPNRKVFLGVDAWDQHHVSQKADPLQAARDAGLEQSYREAKATGGDIAVPIETFLQGAASEDGKGLIEQAKQAPGAKSLEEAKTFHDSTPQQIDALRAEVENAAKQAPIDHTEKAVHDDLVHQLVEAGTDASAAKRQAQIVARSWRTLAERLNEGVPEGGKRLTAQDIADRFPITIGHTLAGDGATTLEQRVRADGLKLNDPEALRLRAEAEARGETPADPNAETGKYPAVQPEQTLEQSAPDGPRGFISFGPDKKFRVSLTAGKDLTTFLHEFGHAVLEIHGDLANEASTPQRVKDDYAKILAHLGVDDRSKIATEHHETFARSFETYLMEGKAPSPDLRGTFARIKEWFKGVYGTLKALGAPLSDDIRGVFDRLLASDHEIAAAEAQEPALFATAKDAGMSDREFAIYRGDMEKAHNAATQKLEQQLIAEERAAHSDAYREAYAKAKAEVTADVDSRPVFKALNLLKDGKMPDGQEGPAFKLSREDLVENYGGEAGLKALPGPGKTKANRGRHIYANEGGVTLDAAAELFGFASGADLHKALIEAPSRDELIKSETLAKLRENGFPDSRLDGSIVDKALDAVHNERRSDVLMAELKALRKREKSAAPIVREKAKQNAEARTAAFAAIPPIELLRATAKETIRGKAIQDLNPNGYLVAARKASREATAAAGKDDFTKAATAKQQELLSHELYRAALDMKAETEKGYKYLRGMLKASNREKIGKAGGWEWTTSDGKTYPTEEAARQAAAKTPGMGFARTSGYLEQMDAMLARFDLHPLTSDQMQRRQSLADWLKDRTNEEQQVAVPGFLVDEALKKPWQTLTVDQAGGVVDAVKNIEAMAKAKSKLSNEQKERNLAEALTKADAVIVKNSRGIKADKIGRSIGDKPGEWFGLMTASLRKFASVVREMDGFQDGGVLHEMLLKPLNEATDREAVMQRESAMKYAELVKAWGKLGPTAAIRQDLPGLNRKGGISLEARIAVALNWGNAGNRIRLLKHFNEGEVRTIIDSLDAKDMHFVQGVLDHINSYWSEIAAKQQRVTGVAPEKVEALPIETKHGTFAGGYYPVSYDGRKSAKAHGLLVADQAKLQMQGGFTSSTTRRGHTEARAEDGLGIPLRLDFGVINEHIARVTHDLAFHETLIDTNKLLRGLQKTIEAHQGVETYKQMSATLTDTAAGQVFAQDGLERTFNWIRSGATTAALAWNMRVALLNVTGITQALARVGPRYMLKAIGRVGRDAASLHSSGTWIDSVSPYMRERSQLGARNIEDVNKRAATTGILEPVRHSFHYFVAKMDRVVGIHAWLGAYEKAMAQPGMDEAKAISIADQTVRDTQGSNAVHDLASVQRGSPLKKAFTAFYHYASTTYNQGAEAVNRARLDFKAPTSAAAIAHDSLSFGRLLSDVACLTVIPATIATAIQQTLFSKKDEDFATGVAQETAGIALGTIPLLRDMTSTITKGAGYKGPTGTRGLEQIGDFAGQMYAEAHAAYEGKDRSHAGTLKSAANVIGVLAHLPSAQAVRTVEGFMDMTENGAPPTALIAGKASHR